MNSSVFRKIDVDQINDEFKEDDNQLDANVQVNGSVTLDEQKVNRLIKDGKMSEALKYLFQCITGAYKNQTAKDNIFNFVAQILFNVKTSEIEKIVDSLNDDEVDTLMKYVYRAFENSNVGNSSNLLVWHDKVYNKGGAGAICRVLTDKKKV